MTERRCWMDWVDSGAVSEIERLALRAPEIFAQFPYALITCLDSYREPPLTSPSLQAAMDRCRVRLTHFGRHLLAGGSDIVALASEGVFNGFDEVWFFQEPPAEGMPSNIGITLERNIGPGDGNVDVDRERSSAEVEAWMRRAGAVLGMSDGCGLTYVTTEGRSRCD